MVNMSMPSICVESVDNGYIVQWKRKLTDEEITKSKSAERTVWVTKVAINHDEFIAIVDEAGKQVADKSAS